MNNHMLTRLTVVYGLPDVPDEKAWLAEAARLLAGYSKPEMDSAVDHMLKTRRYRSWPSIAECVMACQEARERISEPKWQPVPERFPEWSETRIKQADAMIQCALGRTAADEGWVLGLHDFCRNKGRLPLFNEIPAVKASSREFDEHYAMCVRGEGGVFGDGLKQLGDSMLVRRNRLAALAWGEIVDEVHAPSFTPAPARESTRGPDASRPAFEDMQRNSPNSELHGGPRS
jgi:hypothetical protein